MKKIFFIIFLLGIIIPSFSQKTDTIVNGYLSPIIRTSGTAPTFNFKGIFRNKTLSSNGFDTTGLVLEILVSSDGNCYRLPVTNISTISSPLVPNTTIEGTVLDISGELSTIPTGIAAIYSKTDSLKLSPYIEDLPKDLQSCLMTQNFIILDSISSGSGVENSIIRNDSIFIIAGGQEFYSGNNSNTSDSLTISGPILRVPSQGDNLPTTTSNDWIAWHYFAPPTLSSSIIGGTTFEIGTSNFITFRSVLSNPASTNLTNYIIEEQTQGTQVAIPNTNAINQTTDFGFTYAPIQTPVGGVGVWDADEYRFRSTTDYALGADAGSVQSPFRTVRGIYPVLYGMVVDTATAFADPYGTMTKLVQTEGNKTVSYTGTGLIFYGFPQTWSDTNLSSIIDPNGFNVTASFTRVTYPVVTSTGLTNNYTSVPYVFYFLNTGSTTTSASNYTFNR